MRAAVRALPVGVHSRAELAAWSSLPPLYLRWAMGPGGEEYVVAERRVRVVAYAARRGREVTAIFVRPRDQGRGVGRALVEALCAAAEREGRRMLHVLAARAATGFYAALGFRGARAVGVALPGARSLAVIHMRLSLAARPARRAGGTGSAGRRRARAGAGRTPRPRRSAPGR